MTAFSDDLLDLMPDSCTHQAWVGMSTDGYAEPTYSTAATTLRCRFVNDQRQVRTFEGEEEVAMTTMWVASTSTYSAMDLFTLPDGQQPPLLSCETFRDENGVTHSRLGFGG